MAVLSLYLFLALNAGQPDWANFRLLGDYFLRAFFENYKNSSKFFATFLTR
jgi:hypothetical protein